MYDFLAALQVADLQRQTLLPMKLVSAALPLCSQAGAGQTKLYWTCPHWLTATASSRGDLLGGMSCPHQLLVPYDCRHDTALILHKGCAILRLICSWCFAKLQGYCEGPTLRQCAQHLHRPADQRYCISSGSSGTHLRCSKLVLTR